MIAFMIRFFSNKSASCCIPAKKARSPKTRAKTDTRISCLVSLATTCYFLSLHLPVERMTQTAKSRWGPPAERGDVALIAHSDSSVNIMCDLRKLQAFHSTLIAAWTVFPVDTTRVEIMETDSDLPGSDYINANYIRVSLFSISLYLTHTHTHTHLSVHVFVNVHWNLNIHENTPS